MVPSFIRTLLRIANLAMMRPSSKEWDETLLHGIRHFIHITHSFEGGLETRTYSASVYLLQHEIKRKKKTSTYHRRKSGYPISKLLFQIRKFRLQIGTCSLQLLQAHKPIIIRYKIGTYLDIRTRKVFLPSDLSSS